MYITNYYLLNQKSELRYAQKITPDIKSCKLISMKRNEKNHY